MPPPRRAVRRVCRRLGRRHPARRARGPIARFESPAGGADRRAEPPREEHAGDRAVDRGADLPQAVARRRAASAVRGPTGDPRRSEEHTSELQSLMRISYAVLCLKKYKDQISSSLTTYDHCPI